MSASITFRGKVLHFNHDEGFWAGLERTYDLWEPETFDVIDQFLGPGKLLLDIGAWNGVVSLYANAIGAQSLAFEPDHVAYDHLCENIVLNDAKVIPMRIAITGERPGTVQISANGVSGWGASTSSLLPRPEDPLISIVPSLPITALPAYDLIKIDIEGGELWLGPNWVEYLHKIGAPLLLAVHPDRCTQDEIDGVEKSLLEHGTINKLAPHNWLITF